MEKRDKEFGKWGIDDRMQVMNWIKEKKQISDVKRQRERARILY